MTPQARTVHGKAPSGKSLMTVDTVTEAAKTATKSATKAASKATRSTKTRKS